MITYICISHTILFFLSRNGAMDGSSNRVDFLGKSWIEKHKNIDHCDCFTHRNHILKSFSVDVFSAVVVVSGVVTVGN